MANVWAPGSNPLASVAGTLVPQSFIAAAGQTVFNIGNFTYTPNSSSLWVFVNGVFQTSGTDFSETANNQFTFNSGLQGGEIVTCIGMPTVSGATGVGNVASFRSLTINSNATAIPSVAVAGTQLQIVQADGISNSAELDSFGAGNFLNFRRADGTNAAKTAVQLTENLGVIQGWGYGATGYSASARAAIALRANENWTDTAQGTNVIVNTTPNGSIVPATVVTFNSFGMQVGTNLSLGNVTPGSSQVNGWWIDNQFGGSTPIRFRSLGPDAATVGGFVFQGAKSDNSSITNLAVLSSTGLVVAGNISISAGQLNIDTADTANQIAMKTAGVTKWVQYLNAGKLAFFDSANGVDRASITTTGLAVTGAVSANAGSAPGVAASGVQLWGSRTTYVDSARTANNRIVDAIWNGGVFNLQFVNDAFGSGTSFFTATGGQAAGTSSVVLTAGSGVATLTTTGLAVTGNVIASSGVGSIAVGGTGANTWWMDNFGGVNRYMALGPDTSTLGSFSFQGSKSNGTSATALATLSSTGLSVTGTMDVTGTVSAGVAGHITFASNTQSTIGANGAASALTANPLGYLVVYVGTTKAIIPYYNG